MGRMKKIGSVFALKNREMDEKPERCGVKKFTEPACNAGDPGSIPALGRSPGEGHGNPLQYSGESPWTEEPGGLQSVWS